MKIHMVFWNKCKEYERLVNEIAKLSQGLLEQERLHKDEVKAIVDEKYFS